MAKSFTKTLQINEHSLPIDFTVLFRHGEIWSIDFSSHNLTVGQAMSVQEMVNKGQLDSSALATLE